MEKIKLNNQEFNLLPMGIIESGKKRNFAISSALPYLDIETAFTDATNIEYYSESGELLVSYSDGISVKTITKDLEAGTYTIEISTDAVEAELKLLRAQVEALTNQ